MDCTQSIHPKAPLTHGVKGETRQDKKKMRPKGLGHKNGSRKLPRTNVLQLAIAQRARCNMINNNKIYPIIFLGCDLVRVNPRGFGSGSGFGPGRVQILGNPTRCGSGSYHFKPNPNPRGLNPNPFNRRVADLTRNPS